MSAVARKTILVTGGAGFIGSHLVCRAVREGHDVVNLDKLTYAGNAENVASVAGEANYRFVRGDISDRDLVAALVAEVRPDVVFHLAAESHVDRSIDKPHDFIRTNLLGTYEMLDASFVAWSEYTAEKKKKFRFIHVSTDEVFGALGEEGVFDERTPYDPSSPYSATKAGSDHIARAWCRTYGMPVVVTNCSNNFGPSQHPEKFIPTVIRCAVTGAPIPLYGNGRNVRDWLFVEDHADGLLRAADSGKPGATYLFGGRAEFGNEDLCRMICRLLDAVTPSPYGRPYASQITYVAERPGHDFRYAIDPSAAERQLGWKAATSLEEGLTKTIEWYLRNPAWLIRHDGEFGRLGLARASQVKSEVG